MTAALMEWLVSASALIAVVLLLRWLLGKRISAWLRYGLWVVVLIRLLVPVSFFSLPVAVPQLPRWTPPEAMQEETIYVFPVSSLPLESSGVHVTDDATLGDPNSFGYPHLTDDGDRVVRYADKITPLELLKWIWIAGAAALGITLVVSNIQFSHRLRRVRRPLKGTNAPIPVYVAPALPSPCLVGLFFPVVYVTEETTENLVMLRHVLAHELTHYNHHDHLWSVLRGVALAVHWWNPLVWVAVVCSRQDGELACDEGALKRLGDSERAAYGETLLLLVTVKVRPADLLNLTTTMSGGKRSLRERIQRIAHQPKQLVSAVVAVVIVLSLSVLVAFGQAKETDTPQDRDIPSSASGSADDPIAVSPDLDRDGEPEILYARAPENYPDPGEWRLEIRDQSSNLLWSDTLDETHANCNTYFLYQRDGQDYILEYMPKMQQGYCTYTYRLFHLENGEDVTDQENTLTFDINFSPNNLDHKFDPAEIAAFMQEVNGLIGEGELLINTNHWMLYLEEDAEGRLRDNILKAIGYRDSTYYSTEDELVVALMAHSDYAYAAYAADHPDDIESPLGTLLEELTPEDIGDISGQTSLTAAELVDLLQTVSARRTSRYHTYSTFEAEEVWTWSMGEWAVPLTNGGTLHLVACDSGSLAISYETETEAVSAFYRRESTLHSVILRAGTLYSKVLPYEADLDRDGKSDELAMRSESDDGTAWSLQCSLSSGGSWKIEANTAHAGWNAVFLCQMDGADYLLQYVPYFGQMHGEYRYKLFYLDQNDAREVVVHENSLDFQINPTGSSTGTDPVFGDTTPKEIAAFMEEINALLDNSTQLLNTDWYLQGVFANEGRLYDSMIFLQETLDKDKTLLENLLIYRNNTIADGAISEVTSIDRINEEDILTAEREDGTPVSKTELAEIFHIGRSSTFQEKEDWESDYPTIKITYTSPGDTGEQTLLLQAGTSNGKKYVRVTYEGQKTVLQYSDNPDVDGTHLHDFPYSFTGYISTSDFYDCITKLSQ